jgi:mersacidin/lichenicidin family type 2 lantibiotic
VSNKKIVQAWKSEEFRNSLSAAEQSMLPENPAGFIELSCDELVAVNGSAGPTATSVPCLLDDYKFTKDGGTFCGTRDITCPDTKHGSGLGFAVRS